MALKQNIIYIYFKGKHLITSKSQYQYNHGQFLYFADLDLPQAFEVHFSSRDRGESKTQIGSNKLVEIPDEYFWSGALQIYAWIYLHSGADDGETVYEVKIPLMKRAKPTDEEPLPQQQGVIDRAIAELNNAIEITTENANKTNADKTIVNNIKDEVVVLKDEIDSTATTINQKAQEAIAASERAETSAQNAGTSERKALDYSQQAEQSAQNALESKNIAQQKSEVAINASNEALGYKNEALNAKNQAEQAKQNIVDYRDETKEYRNETLSAKNDVQALKGQIEDISDTVNENAQSASQSASSANQSALSANQSANSASQSASQAEQFKDQSEANVTHYPKVVDGYWYVWDATNEEYVNTNVDARGIKGDTGESGVYIGTEEPTDENIDVWIDSDGTADGISDVQVNGTSIVENGVANVPVASDSNFGVCLIDSTFGVNITNTGKLGITVASSAKIKDGTEARNALVPKRQHESVFYGLAKSAGDTTQSQSSNPVGAYTDDAKDAIRNMLDVPSNDDIPTVNVDDVQINGTSIVSNGVANVPIGLNKAGAVQVSGNPAYGININGNTGIITVASANDAEIKAGTLGQKPIAPQRQHMSTFYGLAKAAGDTTQSQSSNAVGSYTEDAKTAIRTMLGLEDVYQDYSSALTALGVI